MAKTQSEREAPAKVYQVDEVANEIAALRQDFAEFKQIIKDQNDKYVTREAMALEVNPIKSSLKTYNRVIWLLASALAPVVVLTFWQLIVNNSRTTNVDKQESSNVRQS